MDRRNFEPLFNCYCKILGLKFNGLIEELTHIWYHDIINCDLTFLNLINAVIASGIKTTHSMYVLLIAEDP